MKTLAPVVPVLIMVFGIVVFGKVAFGSIDFGNVVLGVVACVVVGLWRQYSGRIFF